MLGALDSRQSSGWPQESVHSKTSAAASVCDWHVQKLRRSWYSATFSDVEDEDAEDVESADVSTDVASDDDNADDDHDDVPKQFLGSDRDGDPHYCASSVANVDHRKAHLPLRLALGGLQQIQDKQPSKNKLRAPDVHSLDMAFCAAQYACAEMASEARSSSKECTSRGLPDASEKFESHVKETIEDEDSLLMRERRLLKRHRQRLERREQRRAERLEKSQRFIEVDAEEMRARNYHRCLKREMQRQARRDQRRNDRAQKSR